MPMQTGHNAVKKGDQVTVDGYKHYKKVRITYVATEDFSFQWDGSAQTIRILAERGRMKEKT